jgi:hypothetical protein
MVNRKDDSVSNTAHGILRILRDTQLALMAEHETKINLIEDKDATGEVATVYDEWRAKSGRQNMPGILKCFSHRPDFLREVMKFSDTVHFSEGHLSRKTKEAIASWVSYLNRCPY